MPIYEAIWLLNKIQNTYSIEKKKNLRKTVCLFIYRTYILTFLVFLFNSSHSYTYLEFYTSNAYTLFSFLLLLFFNRVKLWNLFFFFCARQFEMRWFSVCVFVQLISLFYCFFFLSFYYYSYLEFCLALKKTTNVLFWTHVFIIILSEHTHFSDVFAKIFWRFGISVVIGWGGQWPLKGKVFNVG